MQLRIVDVFLNISQADAIENFLVEGGFPWYFRDNLNEHTQLGNYYSNHTFLEEGEMCSDFIDILNDMASLIPVDPTKGYTRIKANLYPRTHLRVHHKSHTDYSKGDNQFTCLYYVNTNNGYTIIDGKKKIKSKKNRAIFFDGSLLHHSTTCTDVNYRCSINFSCMRLGVNWNPFEALPKDSNVSVSAVLPDDAIIL